MSSVWFCRNTPAVKLGEAGVCDLRDVEHCNIRSSEFFATSAKPGPSFEAEYQTPKPVLRTTPL